VSIKGIAEGPETPQPKAHLMFEITSDLPV
jgi:hypothetical protein